VRPAFVGKITTALQVGTIFFSLSFQVVSRDVSYDWIVILCWLTALFTIASGLIYILRGIKYINLANLKEVKK